ncbi:electron transport complex subunit RsxE [Candidatus Sordicultor fermentans]|jgi:electron transport complex protein RnfE|uniref:electron transport complex subunit RsxE n=1 Tax=Candidatus Sordicultor fermentans TaxID=1953203 RepID=UPI00169C5F01|nr:electron transport complex subunit E [Atribacterota bacterium]NLY06403.1 electron transport complex subunit E [Candidatus Atribacteria bacterium]HOA98662.1 electron transport complex subunit E [Candidatus Atribacteria bacterium]HPZ39467.1 electron transport complex subunit E [Candidatus Atribacteria bacterium]HQD32914.1 electron transport complex subunit E [Candidatus Atribacteria bacterium]
MKEFWDCFKNGIVGENPVLRLMIGLCSVLAVSVRLENCLFMGAAVIFVLTGSNLVISAIRNFVPNEVRIPIFIVVISTFTTIVDLVMKAYLPALSEALGVFIPLIVVNCIIMARAEAFASRKPVILTIADSLGMGVGYTLVIAAIGVVRELFGYGQFFYHQIFPSSYQGMMIMILPPGAFLLIGIYIALLNHFHRRDNL